MFLSLAIAQYEPSLICDFAETYHILDYQALPAPLLVTLFSGLGEGSRVQQRLNGEKLPLRTLLLAAIVDRLSVLVYANTTDAKTGRNKPHSLVAILTGEENENAAGTAAYASGDDFEAARRAILEEVT